MTDIPKGSPMERAMTAQAAERQTSLLEWLFGSRETSAHHDRGILPNCLGRDTEGRER